MKLRAITLAAAGLLAAASAQAELQTWRYSGRLMDYSSPPPSRPGESDNVPPEYINIDLTFDTSITAAGNTYANPLVGVVLNGVQLTVQPSDGTLIAGGTHSRLTAYAQNFDYQLDAKLLMHVRSPWDAAAGEPRPITSIDDFLTSADQLIEEVNLDFVQGSGLPWSELAQAPLFRDLIPQIGLDEGLLNQRLYGLIGAHNITPGVPEPSAWALALLGGMGVAGLSRRRQQARHTA